MTATSTASWKRAPASGVRYGHRSERKRDSDEDALARDLERTASDSDRVDDAVDSLDEHHRVRRFG
jgi:hypothetical protein